jgi:hypothetical protein
LDLAGQASIQELGLRRFYRRGNRRIGRQRLGRFEKDAAQHDQLIVAVERSCLTADRVQVHFLAALDADQQ